MADLVQYGQGQQINPLLSTMFNIAGLQSNPEAEMMAEAAPQLAKLIGSKAADLANEVHSRRMASATKAARATTEPWFKELDPDIQVTLKNLLAGFAGK